MTLSDLRGSVFDWRWSGLTSSRWFEPVAICTKRLGVKPLHLLLLAVGTLRADISFPVPTEMSSGVTIKISSPVTSVPHFGFLPLRVSVENLTMHDGTWRFRFDAGMPRMFPGVASSTFELSAPATQTREAWFYVPTIGPGVSINAAALTAGSGASAAQLPSTPPNIPGVYPDPRLPGVTHDVSRNISSGAAGLTRTFTITQTGRASSLPPVSGARLPLRATSSISPPDAEGNVTRTTIVPVLVSMGASGGSAVNPSMIAMTNARSELTRAGLITLSVPTSTAVSMKAGSKPGLQEVTVTLKQTGTAASLPLPPVSSLPPGFTAVNVFPDTANPSNVTREFTYVENVSTIAPIGSSSVAFPPARGLTSVDAQTEARKVLASTNLLSTPPSVKTTPLTQYVSLTPTSGGIPPGGYHIVIFEQTGPASALPVVVSPVPAGVRVVVLPGSGGTVTRVVSVVDAGLINALFSAASSANGPAVAAQATNVARVELQRSGFFRTQPGVTQNPPSTRNSGAAGVAAPDRIIFTETGPANLLPEPPSHVLPTGVTCSVTAGAIPGEVSRNFVVNIPGFLAAGGAVGAAPARPGTVAVSRGSGAMPGPSMLAIDVTGPGVPRAGRAMFPNAINNAAMAPLATTPALEQVVRGKFSSSGSRSPPNIVGFEPMQVPADWRIWSSFNSVLLTTGDFDGLDGARRSALRTWIASGGVLFLSPEAAGDSRTERVGAGRIETLAEPISEVTASDIFTRLQLSGLAPGMPDRERVSFTVGSAMEDMVKFEPVDTLWLSLFLIVFAVLIGPVNLYWLAPTTKRHRLFLTTPLLSIAGAAGVAVAIVLQDGLGGDGLRRALVVLVPGESQAVIFQEQAARSGFLTQREFALDDAVLCAVLPVDGNIYTSGPAGRAFAREQGRAAGDWFGNRARQAHLLRGLAPTRARIELVGTAADGAPTIESTLSTELRDFRLRDADGRTWSASSVPTGRRITLRADDTNSPGTNSNYNGTPNLISLLKDAGTLTEPWQWVANGSGTELAPIVTLRAIRWKDDPIVYAGFAERPGASSRSAAPAAPSTATKGGQ